MRTYCRTLHDELTSAGHDLFAPENLDLFVVD